MRLLLYTVITLIVLSSGLSFKQPLVEEEIKYTAVKCFMQDYEEPIPPPPPPCMLPECLEAIIRVVNIESECTCIDPPPPPVEEIVEQIIEPVPVIAPAPCVVGAYKNGEWMSYLRNYINPDSIDHSEVPYNNYTVLFQYQVLPDGTVTNLIIDGDEFGAGRMLRKAFEQTTLKWVPAIVDGQPVPATYQQMIIFYPDNNTPVSIGEPQLLRFDSWL